MSLWEDTCEISCDDSQVDNVDSTQMTLSTNDEGENVLRMYWIDACEDTFKQQGNLFYRIIILIILYLSYY